MRVDGFSVQMADKVRNAPENPFDELSDRRLINSIVVFP